MRRQAGCIPQGAAKRARLPFSCIGDNMVRKKLPMHYMMNAYKVARWLKFTYRKGGGKRP